nr:MAG TPA: ATP synthase F1 subunit alpha protein [Caudoviricetes sp.]
MNKIFHNLKTSKLSHINLCQFRGFLKYFNVKT